MIKPKYIVVVAALVLSLVLGYKAIVWLSPVMRELPAYAKSKVEEVDIKYGINISDFSVVNHVIKPGEIFADILTKHNVAYQSIHFLAQESENIFSLNKIKAGKNCTVLCEPSDSGLVAKKLIYEENKIDYVVFNLEDSLYIYRGKNKVDRCTKEVSGVINSSLYETLAENDINPALAVRMSEIFAWTVDFYKIQKGDKFKVIYTEDVVEGESAGIGEVSAVMFNSGGKEYYAYYYEKDASHVGEYLDEQGNTMKKMFLKSPVKFSRISSKFSGRRFHPVTKKWKAHLGTDYAAPYGTPILATADGVVEAACFKQFNGNYVKLRHNGQYKTQYLHMSKIAKGIRPGARVRQGDVIGYVGSTGLATGPHVCYRFWKDGAQVDPLKQKLVFADPLPEKYKKDFMAKTASVKTRLNAISYDKHNIAVQKQEKQELLSTEQEVSRVLKQLF
jgi:murein DD-endopeptidase MepM/ murein hydrolase activator NlpD